MCCEAWNIYCLVLYIKKNVPIPSLPDEYYHYAHFIDEKTEF